MKNINIYNIKRWYKMIFGNSIFHVKQNEGLIYSKKELKGYYNDLTLKVTTVDQNNIAKIPTVVLQNNEEIVFPISVFQYGLGSYDLYLLTNDEKYLIAFQNMVQWALDNQSENGSWNNFFYIYPDTPYSSMAQGEGVSLLLRAYQESKNTRYLECAKRALDFMLLPIEKGGTTRYQNGDVIFMEYTHKSPVLNGWIFSIFGLFDYYQLTKDEHYLEILNQTLVTLDKKIKDFDNNYWSLYDLNNNITSSFYHNLHIAQLKVMYDIFQSQEIFIYLTKWEKYNNNILNSKIAFLKKAIQKVLEK